MTDDSMIDEFTTTRLLCTRHSCCGGYSMYLQRSLDVSSLQPLTRFTGRETDYRLYRPSYPHELVDAVLKALRGARRPVATLPSH
jgi:hypothetical protein